MFEFLKSKEKKKKEVEDNIALIKAQINGLKGGSSMVKQEILEDEEDFDDEEEEDEDEILEEDVVEPPKKVKPQVPQRLPALPKPVVKKPAVKVERVEITEIVKETETGFKVPGSEEGQALTKDGLLLWIANKLLDIESRLS